MPSYLLLQDGSRLLLQDGTGALLLQSSPATDPRTFDVRGDLGATYSVDGDLGATYSVTGSLDEAMIVEDIEFDADEDVEVTVTLPTDAGDLDEQTFSLEFEGRNGDGTGAVEVVANTAESKVIRGTLAKDTLIEGRYRWRVKRTDAGSSKSFVGGEAKVNDPVG